MTSLSRNSKLNFNSIDLNLNPKDKLFIFHPRKTLLKKGRISYLHNQLQMFLISKKIHITHLMKMIKILENII